MKTKLLGELLVGEQGEVVRFTTEGETTAPLLRRIRDLGILEGSQVRVLHEAPFGGDPIAISVRGAVIALRRREANLITVQMGGSE